MYNKNKFQAAGASKAAATSIGNIAIGQRKPTSSVTKTVQNYYPVKNFPCNLYYPANGRLGNNIFAYVALTLASIANPKLKPCWRKVCSKMECLIVFVKNRLFTSLKGILFKSRQHIFKTTKQNWQNLWIRLQNPDPKQST